MKKLVLAVVVSLTCLAILLPVIRSVNPLNTIPGSMQPVIRADGWPMPPPTPPGFTPAANSNPDLAIVADGWPMPPPTPPGNGFAAASDSDLAIMADGWPMPPPTPPGYVGKAALAQEV